MCYKCYILIELAFLKELALAKQVHQKCVIFVTIQIFKFQANVYNRCHNLSMMSMNLSDIAILNIKSADCRCIISLISQNVAINLMQNADLTEKSRAL